ncbi:MAG: agmatine deiminase family protein [Pseudomonadota bacterium]
MIDRDLKVLPEWSPQSSVWVGWPSCESLWQGDLEPARGEVRDLVAALATSVAVRLIASGPSAVASAEANCGRFASIVDIPMGDIWIRDTGPLYILERTGLVGVVFRFNGWGEKYNIPGDQDIALAMLATDHVSARPRDFVLEGGAVDHDGHGCLMTTKQCMLNTNRNPDLSKAGIEARLLDCFGGDRIIWLDQGIVGDHTDGHIDNLARFVGKGRVICQRPSGPDDPNEHIFAAAERELRTAGLDVMTIASPGHIRDTAGNTMPASHLNFVFANDKIIMPVFEDRFSAIAVADLQRAMPEFDVLARPARHILTGGGAFHCITQQVPERGGA